MAFLNELGTGRHNRFFQKFFNMKGGPPARQLGSDLMPVVKIFHGRENRYLEEWRMFGARAFQSAVAAQDTVVRLNNPKGSNIIAVIESIVMWEGIASSDVICEFSNTDSGLLANTYTPAAFDNRFQPPGSGSNGAACQLTSTTNVGQGTHFLFADVGLGSAGQNSNDLIQHEDQEIPMLPNSDIQFRTAAVNTSLMVAIRWRERALEDSERA